MTGYGRGEKGNFVAEVRSFNHRFLDISLKIPKTLSPLEVRIKKELQGRFSRGKFEVSIIRTGEEEARAFIIDRGLAHQYYKVLEGLKRDFKLKGEIDLALMASMSDLITIKEMEEDIELAWKDMEVALKGSIEDLIRMRSDEGEFLKGDLLRRVEAIERHLDKIEARCPQVVQNHREKLIERVKAIRGEIEIDESRLHFEVALFAERCDVTEEIVRVRSHLRQFRNTLEKGGAIGKRLDFLIQEIVREINTMSSKANDAEISQKAVDIKDELERIREQVQNIE